MKPVAIAKKYFRLSNQSDFDGIGKLLSDSTKYSSQNTGVFIGKDDIITMQKNFHSKFSSLSWKVNSVEEVKPGVVLFDYSFEAKTKDEEVVKSEGLEYVIVHNNKIQHIEIKSKS